MKKVAILFFSTSRYEYLIPTLDAFEKLIDFSGLEVYKIFTDDYPKTRDHVMLDYIKKRYKIDKMVLNKENLGYSVTWNNAWKMLPEDTDYVWQQEDDLQPLYPISVLKMIETFENSPTPLYQLILKRNVCYENNDFVRDINEGKNGVEIEVNGQPIVKFKCQWFIAHPGIYPYWITKLKYPYNVQEGIILPTLLSQYPYHMGAVWGHRSDSHYLEHLGEYNQGKRCIEGEPGFNKNRNEDKQYYSLKYLVEWKGSRNAKLAALHQETTGNVSQIVHYWEKSLKEDSDGPLKYQSAMNLLELFPERKDELYRVASKADPSKLDIWYYFMIKHMDQMGIAYAYGKYGYELAYLKNQENNDLYNYLFIFNFCIVCQRSGNLENIEYLASLVKKEKTPKNIWEQHLKNMKYYISKPRTIPYNTPTIMAIDNFLSDPMAERKFALEQEFKVSGNFPGKRTEGFATEADRRMLENILGKKITYWPGGYNGSYQYCLKDMRSWIHRDLTTCSAILFLTPNPPPNSGTKIYVHKSGGTYEKDDIDGQFNKDSRNYDAWHVQDVVENKFNRLIIFQGVHSHQSADYFGDSIENGRLFKVFFFNCDGCADYKKIEQK